MKQPVVLEIRRQDRHVEILALDADTILVGRSPSADVTLDHPSVSRQHARIWWSASGLEVSDLLSLNGTILNGETIETAFLENGDVLRLGDFELRICLARPVRPRQELSQDVGQATLSKRDLEEDEPK